MPCEYYSQENMSTAQIYIAYCPGNKSLVRCAVHIQWNAEGRITSCDIGDLLSL